MQSALFDYSAENVALTTTPDVIQFLIDLVGNDPKVLDKEQIAKDVFNREKVSSTLLLNTDIVLPHAKTTGLMGMLTGIVTLKAPISFDGTDKLARTFILVIASPDMIKPYLKKLSMIANIFGYKNV